MYCLKKNLYVALLCSGYQFASGCCQTCCSQCLKISADRKHYLHFQLLHIGAWFWNWSSCKCTCLCLLKAHPGEEWEKNPKQTKKTRHKKTPHHTQTTKPTHTQNKENTLTTMILAQGKLNLRCFFRNPCMMVTILRKHLTCSWFGTSVNERTDKWASYQTQFW